MVAPCCIQIQRFKILNRAHHALRRLSVGQRTRSRPPSAPLRSIFYYANSAWWYFSLILQLYLVFPFLFRLLQKTGIAWFLILCALETVLSRYLILAVLGESSRWVQGGFFGCRLWEFALGMALGLTERKSAGTLKALILSPHALVFGVAIYGLGLYSYDSAITNTVTDALTGTGCSSSCATSQASATRRTGVSARR
jgi:peptidoglycan/LPS O-acetylase OafA/YrhL